MIDILEKNDAAKFLFFASSSGIVYSMTPLIIAQIAGMDWKEPIRADPISIILPLSRLFMTGFVVSSMVMLGTNGLLRAMDNVRNIK